MITFAKLSKEDTQSTVRVTSTVPMDHAEVSRDGLRAVDSGIFMCPSRIAANIGDEYKYIQDIADTTHLRGAYLFQGSCLDESGYNNDPVNQTHGTISGFTDYDGLDYTLTTATNKFKNFYGATATTNGKGAIIPNKFLKDGTTNIFDFSGDFDIFCWVEPDSTDNGGVIFSKVNSNGEGITIKMNKSSGQFYPSCEFHRSDATGSLRTVSDSNKKIDGDIPCLIRFQRKGDTFNLWFVRGDESIPFGTPDDTYSFSPHSYGSFSVPTDAVIGAKADNISTNTVTTTNTKFGGKLYSIRIYSNLLDSTSAQQIFASRPIPLIMKLAGTVWKIESNIDQKKIYVKGFGKVIIDTLVSEELLTSGTATGEYYQYSGSRTLTAFTNATPIEIIRAIFAKLNTALSSSPSFKLSVRDLTSVSNVINSYKAEGNFLEIIDQLMTIVDKSFYVSPRGKCIIENQEIDLTGTLKFGKKYNISADGFDDTLTVNDLYVSTRAGGNFNIIHTDDSTSINLIGIYSKRILAPQITDATAATNFMNKFIAKYKDINSRYTVIAPALIDFVRENFKVKVTNTTKNLDINTTIKSITWTYPEARTTIETGDFLLDAFDIEKTSAEAIQNLVTDTNLNP